MGGEKSSSSSLLRWGKGSPPHGRGKGSFLLAQRVCDGITPAWAGKSFHWHSLPMFHWDHPRMGGEKLKRLRKAYRGKGSPPHGRGKVYNCQVFCRTFRITPAWAGKSRSTTRRTWAPKDHPRMGGEKLDLLAVVFFVPGSPPHGRGKGPVTDNPPTTEGITPAWAGKRLKRSHRSGIFISGPIPFHSVLHRPAGSGGSRAGRDGSPAGQPQNAGPA